MTRSQEEQEDRTKTVQFKRARKARKKERGKDLKPNTPYYWHESVGKGRNIPLQNRLMKNKLREQEQNRTIAAG